MSASRHTNSPRPTVRGSGDLRAWLLKHRVYSLDASSPHVTVMYGIASTDKRSVSVAPKDVMRQLDGEIVWLHDTEGKLLPPNTLLALRASLRRVEPTKALKAAA